MKDKSIMICGGEDPAASARAACYHLDPDLGDWARVDLTVGRKRSSSSLIGEKGYILITGGKNAGGNVLDSGEYLRHGSNFIS